MPAFAPLSHRWIVPAIYLALVGHFVSTLMVASTKRRNILKGLPPAYNEEEYDDAEKEITLWIVLSCVIFVLNFTNLFIGYSVFFSKTINLVKLILHALGGMRIAMFTVYEFNYKIIWQFFLLHNIPSLLLDGWVLYSTWGLKKKTY